MECPICLDDINIKDEMNYLKTECGHYFHSICLFKFDNETCPLCRQTQFIYKDNFKNKFNNYKYELINKNDKNTNYIKGIVIEYKDNNISILLNKKIIFNNKKKCKHNFCSIDNICCYCNNITYTKDNENYKYYCKTCDKIDIQNYKDIKNIKYYKENI